MYMQTCGMINHIMDSYYLVIDILTITLTLTLAP